MILLTKFPILVLSICSFLFDIQIEAPTVNENMTDERKLIGLDYQENFKQEEPRCNRKFDVLLCLNK